MTHVCHFRNLQPCSYYFGTCRWNGTWLLLIKMVNVSWLASHQTTQENLKTPWNHILVSSRLPKIKILSILARNYQKSIFSVSTIALNVMHDFYMECYIRLKWVKREYSLPIILDLVCPRILESLVCQNVSKEV